MRMGLAIFLPGKGGLTLGKDPAVAKLLLRMERALLGEEELSLVELEASLQRLPADGRKTPSMQALAAWLHGERGQFALSLSMFDHLLEHWQSELGGPNEADALRWIITSLAYEGLLHVAMGHQDLARQSFTTARSYLSPLLPPTGPTRILQIGSEEAERLSHMEPSGYTDLLLDTLRLFDYTGQPAGVARVANNLGHVYLEHGDPSRARFWLERSVELLNGSPGNMQLSYALDSLGLCYQQLGLVTEARQVLHEALRRSTELGATFLQASILMTLGNLHRDSGEPSLAIELYQKASRLVEHLRFMEGSVRLQIERCILYRRMGQFGLALEAANESRKAAPEQCDRIQAHLLACWVLLGRPEAAELLDRLVQRLRSRVARQEESLALWYRALAAHQAGRRSAALAYTREALGVATEYRQLYPLALELPVTATLLQPVVEQGLCPEALAGLVQRATPAGLSALLEHVPACAPILAAAGRLGEAKALSFRLLGLFQVTRSGRPLDLSATRSQKAVSLLKFLVGHRGRAVVREQILEAVWPEADPTSAERSFEVTLSTLRRLLDPADGPHVILRRGRGYLLNPEIPFEVDVDRFTFHLERGNWWWTQGQREPAEAEWRTAEAIYGGDLLAEDPYEDWAIAERERLREEYLDLHLRLGELALSMGRPHEAVLRANRVLAEDPIRESAYRILMRAHAKMGDRAVALRDYRRCAAVLRQELGEEPMSETQELAARIRSGRI